MRFYLIYFLFLFKINNLFSQETTFIVNPISNNLKEEFYVLKNDKTIKSGFYKKTNFNLMVEEGFYRNNIKDSIWKIYEDGHLSGSGYYKDNNRIGIWEFFNSKNEVTQKYDFTTKELLFVKDPNSCLPDSQYQIIKVGTDTLTSIIERRAVRLGIGENSKLLVKYLNTYPEAARVNNIEGKVKIEYWINENGDVVNFKPITNFGYGLEDEALRVVKEILKDTKWVPAKYKGKNVSVRYVYPVNFKL